MFRKIKVRSLSIVFIALLALVVIVFVIDSKKGDRTFRSEIVDADTSKISSIIITPKDKNKGELKIEKKGNGWIVQHDDKSYSADKNKIRNILGELEKMSPTGIAAIDEAKWQDFEVVDSMAVKVELKSKGKTLTDLLIGKFSYQQPTNPYDRQGKMTTYVRLADEDEVYAVDGFLQMTFSQDVNAYRNKQVIKSNYNDWNRLTFSYPDSSFTMMKQNDNWMIGGLMADSTEVANYLNAIDNLNSSHFVDDAKNAAVVPSHSLKIEGDNLTAPIEIKAFPADSVNQYLINSSQNADVNFSGKEMGLFDKIFVGKSKFKVSE